jgi:hypothetical protein
MNGNGGKARDTFGNVEIPNALQHWEITGFDEA